MKAFLIPILALILILTSSCRAQRLAVLNKISAYDAATLASKDDQWMCTNLTAFGFEGNVPVKFLREAQKRKLEYCIQQGMRRKQHQMQIIYGGSSTHCQNLGGGVTHCY